MSTLVALEATIPTANRITLDRTEQSYGADRIIIYRIVYQKPDGYVSIQSGKVYVKDFGLAGESANWMGVPPSFVVAPLPTAFETTFAAKKAALIANNPKFIRIINDAVDVAQKCALVTLWYLDAATPALAHKRQYFVYDDGTGTIKANEYTAVN